MPNLNLVKFWKATQYPQAGGTWEKGCELNPTYVVVKFDSNLTNSHLNWPSIFWKKLARVKDYVIVPLISQILEGYPQARREWRGRL